MALNQHTADDLDDVAKKLRSVAMMLASIATRMRVVDRETVKLNTTMQVESRIPELVAWARKCEVAADGQIDMFQRGRESRTEIQHRYTQRKKPEKIRKSVKKSRKS